MKVADNCGGERDPGEGGAGLGIRRRGSEWAGVGREADKAVGGEEVMRGGESVRAGGAAIDGEGGTESRLAEEVG